MEIPIGKIKLQGDLVLPDHPKGLVLFAHGSGSSRFSKRNRYVAGVLNKAGIATLLFDLLTEEEEKIDMVTAALRFDIDLLTKRLIAATEHVLKDVHLKGLKIGYFGASTGAAAALNAAAHFQNKISAVVSRGGRPDLALEHLPEVKAPTLLIVGGHDEPVIEMNKKAHKLLSCEKLLKIVEGATHLFEEEGALESVAKLALDWFLERLG